MNATAPDRIWIKNPLSDTDAGAGVVVEAGTIVELVPSGQRPERVCSAEFDASRHVVLPGLINTHHHYLFPAGLENAIDIQAGVSRDIGIRVVLTRGSMSLSQKDGGLPPDSVVQDEETILADSERLVKRYHQREAGAMVQIALAPCSPFSVTREIMEASSELAHGIHFDEHEAQRLGANVVGFCPTLNLESAGSPVGLGREDIGKIAVGKQADLALFLFPIAGPPCSKDLFTTRAAHLQNRNATTSI